MLFCETSSMCAQVEQLLFVFFFNGMLNYFSLVPDIFKPDQQFIG